MKTTFRVNHRTWVPDLDGGKGHTAERLPREFPTEQRAASFLGRVDRLYDARISKVTEEVIYWHDPSS